MSGTIELVLGGARSGKSDFAVARARLLGDRVLFVATAEPRDEDMSRRIAAHRATRPVDWHTLEEPLAVAQKLRERAHGYDVVVLDCVTLLVSNWLLAGWLASGGAEPPSAAITGLVDDLCDALSGCAAHAVVVSNEVGGGTVPEHAVARRFRDELGTANRIIAEKAEVVRLLVAGLPLVLKEKN